MLFNSIDFAIFLPIVFLLYWFVVNKNLQWQNLLLLAASYLFYGWWDWRFLSLILLSTLIDFIVGIRLSNSNDNSRRKRLLWLSLLINLGSLGFFKYYNFFIDNFIEAFSVFGFKIEAYSLKIVLPVGISFYTFQTLSYTIDVYRRKIEPTRNLIAFAAFVSFFPQLVAGPIERASNLLPQFFRERQFNKILAVDGMRQILWGLFKKVVVADNCAYFVNLIFNNSESYSGSTLILGVIFFSFQIYGDFSGYSDIAIGTARLFGFDLMKNFAFPYFSRDIAEFWRRWHISLSTWFRDYVYIPLGGSRGDRWKIIRNTFVVFVVSGFWHGANWTFVVWGAINALYFLPLLLTKRNRLNTDVVAGGKLVPSIRDFFSIAATFGLTTFAWIFFRADDIRHATSYVARIFSSSLFSIPEVMPTTILVLLIFFLIVEWLGREKEYAIAGLASRPKLFRWCIYYCFVILIILWRGQKQEFIYFQF